MMNPYLLERLVKERHKDLLREAEAERLVRQVTASQPKRPALLDRLLESRGRMAAAISDKLRQIRTAAYAAVVAVGRR